MKMRTSVNTSFKERISVTSDRIQEAIRRNSSACMAADAIKEALPWAKSVSVDIQTMRLTDPEARLRYIFLTPRRVQEHIVDWDAGVDPEPFDFMLGKPTQIVKAHMGTDWKKPTITGTDRKAISEALDQEVILGGATAIESKKGAIIVIGGKTPPKSRGSSGVRAFGIKGLKR
jgi:hypothetical protein